SAHNNLFQGVLMKTLLTSTVFLSSLLLGACLGAEEPDVNSNNQAATTCTAVGIITARASGEAAGEGITSALVDQIINTSTQTVSRASVDYPATLNNY